METQITLTSMFSSQKKTLENQLKNLTLPKDAVKIQGVVSNYLNNLFDKEGEFRQNLTQAEDYILQAALSLLNAQQEISSVFAQESGLKGEEKNTLNGSAKADVLVSTEGAPSMSAGIFLESKVDSTKALLGSGGGALVGNVLLGGWGAVFGAIAGTAVAIYLSSKNQAVPQVVPTSASATDNAEKISAPINVESFVRIVSDICASIDSLIATFRAQINRVVAKYDTVEKPTLESEFSELLGNIQSLLGAAAMNPSNEMRVKRIDQRIQLLAESLEVYDITILNYDGSNKQMFNAQPSENVTEDTMVTPAILKNGKVIIKGKLFVKA